MPIVLGRSRSEWKTPERSDRENPATPRRHGCYNPPSQPQRHVDESEFRVKAGSIPVVTIVEAEIVRSTPHAYGLLLFLQANALQILLVLLFVSRATNWKNSFKFKQLWYQTIVGQGRILRFQS